MDAMTPGFVRMFHTALDPADLEQGRRLFADDILPVFRDMDGCLSMELVLSVEHNPGGLLECTALSRWVSREAMEAAMGSRAAKEAQVRIFQLLRQEPVVRVFEVLE
ncbi:MAG: antibiotic biosynthesis monooxygenase family protein [Acidimicrobiales bacterium]